MELEPRNTQTKVKHMILAKYLDTWGGIIFNPLRATARKFTSMGRSFDFHFVYVDCFAYKGKYAGDSEDILRDRSVSPVTGSPIIGIRSLDKLAEFARRTANVDLRINTILVEEKLDNFTDLRQNLADEGFGQRVRETTDFSSLKPNEIAIVNADCVSLRNELVNYTTEGYTWAFYLLDPYGPSGIPHDFIASIIQQDHHDAMINFPYQDLHRKTGFILSDKVGPVQQQLVNYWTDVFGSEKWKEIASAVDNPESWLEVLRGIPLTDLEKDTLLAGGVSEFIEGVLVRLYRITLGRMDPQLAVKLIDLQFPDKERTMFYLFLTTHDPTGALSLNKILHDAKLWEHELRYRYRFAKKTTAPGQLSLFTIEPDVPNIEMPRPPVEEIVQDIVARFGGKTVEKREVFRKLADEIYSPSEIDKALSLLRKTEQAQFDTPPRHDTLIRFSNP